MMTTRVSQRTCVSVEMLLVQVVVIRLRHLIQFGVVFDVTKVWTIVNITLLCRSAVKLSLVVKLVYIPRSGYLLYIQCNIVTLSRLTSHYSR